jgi:hypothetical protein
MRAGKESRLSTKGTPGRAAIEARNFSRKACPESGRRDAKAAKKIHLSSPFGKEGKRGILPKWRPADAVQGLIRE